MKKFSLFASCVTLAAASAAFSADKKGDPEKGKEVLQQCGVCHNADNNEKKMGPGLKGLFKQDKLASNGKKVTEANVRAKIDEGGNSMPAYKEILSDEDKDNVIAYLKTL